MKVTIVSHEPAPPESADEIHRFSFWLDDGPGLPKNHFISLRTARVIVKNLVRDDAFTRMLRAIVDTDAADYDSLINTVYED
jgi:hypothetical protein